MNYLNEFVAQIRDQNCNRSSRDGKILIKPTSIFSPRKGRKGTLECAKSLFAPWVAKIIFFRLSAIFSVGTIALTIISGVWRMKIWVICHWNTPVETDKFDKWLPVSTRMKIITCYVHMDTHPGVHSGRYARIHECSKMIIMLLFLTSKWSQKNR